MNTVYLPRYKWLAWLAAAIMAGFVGGFFARERADPGERLSYQSSILVNITRDAMRHRALPKRIEERVETELQTSVTFSSGTAQQEGLVVLPPETGFLGMGGRWIVHFQTGKDGRCDTVWLELQPVGYL